MATPDQHEKRAQEIADATRRFSATLNGGAVGVAFTLFGILRSTCHQATNCDQTTWPINALPFFVLGLICTGVSLFVAKERELRRRDAALEARPPPSYEDKFFMQSFTWDGLSFICFVIGAAVAWALLTRL